MDSKTKNDIELVSSEDLLEELGNRFDSAIFAGIEIGDRQDIAYRIKGSLTSAIGMTKFIEYKSMSALTGNGW